MGLDYHWTACGKRGCGISPGNGESEREVACAENGNGAERPQHGAEIGTRLGLALRQRGIDAGLHPGALFHHPGKHAQLAGGAAHLAQQTGHGQCGFKMCAFGQFLAIRFKAISDAAEECRSSFAAGLRVGGEGIGGKSDGAVDLLRGGGVEDGLQGGGGLRVGGLKARARGGTAVIADEGESGEFHVSWNYRTSGQDGSAGGW